MSTTITTAEAIPPAPYFVLSDNAFMSDWGEAEGRGAKGAQTGSSYHARTLPDPAVCGILALSRMRWRAGSASTCLRPVMERSDMSLTCQTLLF